MSATLIVATDYLPIPAGTQSYTLKDDSVYYSLEGARSYSVIKQAMSIGRTYRNELPAGYIGRQWLTLFQGVESILLASPPATGPYVKSMKPGDVLDATSVTTPTELQEAVVTADDRFSARPPFNDERNFSYHVFWDGQTGSGMVVATCLSTLFEQFSPNPPTHY